MRWSFTRDTKTDQSWTSHLSSVQTWQMDVRVRGEINRSSGGETGLNTQIRSPSTRPFIYLSQLTSAALDRPRGYSGWGTGTGVRWSTGYGHWSSLGVRRVTRGHGNNGRLILRVTRVTWPSWTPTDNTLTIATGWHSGHIILLYGTGRLPIFCCQTCSWFMERATFIAWTHNAIVFPPLQSGPFLIEHLIRKFISELKTKIVVQGGHIRAEIKFPVFSLSFPSVTNFFPVFFFSIKLIDGFE